jgi:tetratricopeptide (TPR) repeat protein
MRTLRSAYVGAVVLFGLAAGGATAAPKTKSAATSRKPATARPGAAERAPVAATAVSPRTQEIADALPTNNPAALDLYLGRDAERRADALAHFAQGLLAEDNADGDAALEHYKRAFERDPANAELAVKLAFMLASRNDAPGGIQVLKDTVKWAPREPMPLIYLAQLYAKYLKKPEVALKYAEQALALDPTFYPAYVAVHEIAGALGQTAKAEQVLQKAASSASTDPQYWLNVASLHAQAYLKDDGVAASADALARMNALFRKAGELGKSQALIQAKVGNYFVDSRQVKEAIPYYESANRLRQPTDDEPALTNVGDKLAAAYTESGRRDEAITVLEQVTKENPLRFESFEVLGRLYEEKGDFDRAVRSYKQSLLIDASEPQNHLRVLRMQLRMKRFDEAVDTAKATRQRFPTSLEALYLLATALSSAKKHTEAMAVYAEALHEFENGHQDLLDSGFYLSYGAAAEQAGLTEKAAELLRKSIELDPNGSAQAYNYLGYMWVDRGENLDEAGELIKKAVEMEPDNGAFLDSLGWFYYKKADFPRALQFLLKAEGVTKPEDPTVMEHIGDTYQQLGKAAQALQYWQKSLTLDAENKKIAEKIDRAKQKVAAGVVTETAKQ